MGSYITKKKTEFVHQEDRCPSNTDESTYVCVTYDNSTKAISRCPGHRNKNENRNLVFETYNVGSIIDNQLPNTIINKFIDDEINARKSHELYKNIQTLYANIKTLKTNTVEEESIISHELENIINTAIGNLNKMILDINDYGILGKTSPLDKKVESEDLAEAENLKYLEQNILSLYRDCICYSDCTCHGLSSYTERVWCESYAGY